jgi:hypothetical protein
MGSVRSKRPGIPAISENELRRAIWEQGLELKGTVPMLCIITTPKHLKLVLIDRREWKISRRHVDEVLQLGRASGGRRGQ